jgi:hypothetical protein
MEPNPRTQIAKIFCGAFSEKHQNPVFPTRDEAAHGLNLRLVFH